jgi:hypothetical protein
MNTKKDEPEKKETGAGAPGGARPHATLDLKATVVKDAGADAPRQPGKDQKPVAPSTPASAAAVAAAETAKAKPGSAPPAGAPANAPRRIPDNPADGPSDKSSDKGPSAAGAKPAFARPAGSGGFFTHLAAGIAGGIVALLAADIVATQLGLSGAGEQADVSAALRQRVEVLESASKGNAASAELASRLKAAEAKIGKLAQLSGSIDTLDRSQRALGRDVKSLDAKVDAKLGAAGGDANAAARLTKLEDQLTALTEAAARDPNGGGLPQLAAVTGKVSDLESTMTNQLNALRKSVSEEIDTRLAAASEASEAAKSGTQRIDRELSGLKADNAQLVARLNALTAESERANQTLSATQGELTQLKVDLNARLPNFARPEDVTAATAPLADKISTLQQDVQGVVKGEEERKQTAGRIVLSLELANLKRAIDRGHGYAAELAQARKLSDSSVDLAPLARFADTGVPTLAELRQDFKAVAFKIIDSEQQPADGSIMDRLLAGAKSVVRVRKVSHESGDKSVEAVVSRMEAALNTDRLDDVIAEAKTLPPAAQDAAGDFLAKVEARNAVDRALTSVETQLKASLVSPPAAAAPSGQ